jgi:hypothetical protein
VNVPHASHLREISSSVRAAPVGDKVDYYTDLLLMRISPLVLDAAKCGAIKLDYTADFGIRDTLEAMSPELRIQVIVAVNDKLRKMCGYTIYGTETTISWE